MMPDNIDQNLYRGADSPQLFHCFIDQRLSFCVKILCLFDHRLCSIEKIDQRLARRQRFLNLSKLCVAETRNVTNEVKEPVLQHNPPCYWLYRWPINPCNRTDSPASQVSFYTKWPAKAAVGRFCCRSRLREASKRDSVVLTRIAARSIHDGPSEE